MVEPLLLKLQILSSVSSYKGAKENGRMRMKNETLGGAIERDIRARTDRGG